MKWGPIPPRVPLFTSSQTPKPQKPRQTRSKVGLADWIGRQDSQHRDSEKLQAIRRCFSAVFIEMDLHRTGEREISLW